jgi:hypothetical protein
VLSQTNTNKNLIGTWVVTGKTNSFIEIYCFKDSINLWITKSNEKTTLIMKFIIDTVNNEQIMSIIDNDIEKMSRGFRTYKLRILNKDEIMLNPYTIIFFDEKSGKIRDKDASKEPQIHLSRMRNPV